MKKNALNIPRLSYLNIKRRPVRAVLLAFLTAVLSFSLFGGVFMTISLKNGLNTMSQRLGADVLAVPKGYEETIEGAILRGEPSTFYFGDNAVERLNTIDGVDHLSPQLYIGSLKSPCCQLNLQLIGIDDTTDFVVKPWLSQKLNKPLQYKEIAIGGSVEEKVGDHIRFFNNQYLVVAKLEKSGLGFDNSVFMNLESARELVKLSEEIGGNPNADVNHRISSVMIKLKNGYDSQEVAKTIESKLGTEGITALPSQSMLTSSSQILKRLVPLILTIAMILVALSIFILAIVFTLSVNERKKEFSILRILGANRARVRLAVLTEALYLGVAGSLAGILVASAIVFPFSNYLRYSLGLPYLLPAIGESLLVLLLAFILSALTGPLAALYSAFQISKAQTYVTIRENE